MALPEIIKGLLDSGVHFGHLSKHWNPKMAKYIFGKKKNIYIINLEKTAQKLEEAKEFVKKVTQRDGKILFVATKKQLRDLIKEQVSLCAMPYVVERWVGGFLTNFPTIRERVKKYKDLMEKRSQGAFEKTPGKELVRLNRMMQRMEKNYSGVINLESLPQCIFVVDPKREIACIREANKLSIPIVALIDTDADPDTIEYPIPGNDDAMKSVKYVILHIVEAIKAGLTTGLTNREVIDVKQEQTQSQPIEQAAEISDETPVKTEDGKAPAGEGL